MLRSFLAQSKTLFACALIALGFSIFALPSAFARESQTQNDTDKAERQRAFEIYDQNQMTDAAPLLEKLAQKNPNDVVVISRLGFALYASSIAIKEPELRRLARKHAREVLLRAKELGDKSDLTQSALDTVTINESGEVSFSAKQEADKAMKAGEAAFVQGDFENAIAAYQRAMKADPTLYEAPLFAGDVYFKSNRQEKAGAMFAQAVAINPDRETAYRYWGDALMKQSKMLEARGKFIEGYLAEPYSRFAIGGFLQWANVNKIRLGHPRIDIPSNVKQTGNNQTTITIDESILKGGDADGSSAWMMYGISRASWQADGFAKFKKAYPNERNYRHNLAEEAEALYLVAENVKAQAKGKSDKQLNPSLQSLLQLDKDGLLEAYILLAHPDQGIAQDYAAYRKAHSDKLHRYVMEVMLVIANK